MVYILCIVYIVFDACIVCVVHIECIGHSACHGYICIRCNQLPHCIRCMQCVECIMCERRHLHDRLKAVGTTLVNIFNEDEPKWNRTGTNLIACYVMDMQAVNLKQISYWINDK